MQRLLAVCMLALVLLAGCSSSKQDDGGGAGTSISYSQTSMTGSSTTTGAASPYTLTISNFPEVALQRGAAFNFQLDITGPDATSDHLGAHFTNHAVPDPTVGAYDVSCNHVATTVPGTYSVTCTAPSTAGTYYLRAHLRLGTAPDQTHSWSAEKTFSVA